MSAQLPDSQTRLRCGHCGNLTRFDVVRTSKVKEYWHASMAGDVQIEDREVMAEELEVIVCRWCSASDQIELVLRPDLGGPSRESAGDGGP
jgi:hypothetical protein